MNSIIPWLCEIEELAHNFYKTASGRFHDDSTFSSFLSKLAEDEELHLQMISDISKYLDEPGEKHKAGIKIDEGTKDRIEKPLREYYKKIQRRKVSKKELIDLIVRTEFSEWNDIFLYVIQTYQEQSKEFQHLAATIEAHKKRIESFIDGLPPKLKPAIHVRELPEIWQKKFLLVEDNQQFSDTLARILSWEWRVEKTDTGEQALQMMRKDFFDVILSDVDLPVMDGLEFLKKASEMDSDIPKHFILMSGVLTFEVQSICKNYQLPFLQKPFSVDQLKQTVKAVEAKNA